MVIFKNNISLIGSAFLVVILISTVISCKKTKATDVKEVTVDEMNTTIQYDGVQVVDVRSEQEYNKSHLVNAKNIIYDENFMDNLKDLDKERPIAIYCTSGRIGNKAAKLLKEAGFSNIYIMDEGIKRWVGKGS
jgi:rhodanese-related sulfurtransferase